MDYYEISPIYSGVSKFKNQLYTYDELVKVVANALASHNLQDGWSWFRIYRYKNVQTAYQLRTTYPNGHVRVTLHVEGTDLEQLNDTQINHLKVRAQDWYDAAPETWPGQKNYYRQTNQFGQPVRLPIVKIKTTRPFGFSGPRPTPHSYQDYKHGRVNHPMSAFARSQIYFDDLTVELQGDYPLRHPSRRHRNHPENRPAFDDAEYIRARRSTGWKATRRYQYRCPADSPKFANVQITNTYFNPDV